uniref:Uncharacterized protein n=1 Tax=Moniliophthora roreri TaxID=221103 RepID=A0A0W0FJY9_MONRR
MEVEPIPVPPPSNIKHRRSMTAAAYNYTRQQFWHVISGLIIFFDPYVRPFVRATVIEFLRWFLSRIPLIISAVVFDIHNLNVRYNGEPNIELSVDKIQLLTSLQFVPVKKPIVPDTRSRGPRAARRSYSMAAWKSRLSGSIRRSWSRVVAEQEAKAKISLKLDDIVGSLPSAASPGRCKFLRLPGSISVDTSLAFDFRRRALKSHSMNTNVSVGACYVELGPILAATESMEDARTHESPESDIVDGVPAPSSRPSFLYIPSPTPSNFSVQSPRSPRSMPTLSPSSPRSPRSPFLESISAAIAFLNSIQIKLSSISFTSQLQSEDQIDQTFTTSVDNVVVKAGLSDPQKSHLHSKWLGRNVHNEAFDSDVYSVSLSIDRLRVNRHSHEGRLRLLALNSINWQILTTQWPSPLLVTSPFMGGDPNAPTLIVSLAVRVVHITENASTLLSYARRFEPKRPMEPSTPTPTPSPPSPMAPLPIPRIVLELECGPVSAILLIPQDSGRSFRALEMKLDGVVATSYAQFMNRHDRSGPATDQFDDLPLIMANTASLSLKSMFLRIRSNVAGYVSSDYATNLSSSSPAEEQSLVSLETIEIACRNTMLAMIKDDTQNTACVDVSTMESKASCFTDTVCIEIWHPLVRDVLEQLVSLIPVRPRSQPPRAPGASRLLIGSFDLSFQKIVLFVTAPDINPNDELGLSRGFSACATGLSAQWDALGPRDLCLSRKANEYWENRNKLSLPEDLKARSVVAAAANISGMARITLPRIAVRSAIATQYAPDDPDMTDKEDPILEKQKFLQMEGLRVDYSQRNFVEDIHLHVSYIRGSFSLSHVYSVMLASQTFKKLGGARAKSPESLAVKEMQSFSVKAHIDTIQIQCALRTQQVVCRFDQIRVFAGLKKPVELYWERALAWVRLPAAVNRWEDEKGFKWEEIIAMQKWNVSAPLPLAGRPISIEGGSARIHIPSGFILADLILDLSVIVKACKHLHHITKSGQYFPVPEPEAEGPKSVPKLSIQIGFLCFQAADDALESKLCLIFRSGPKAAQSRAEREKAFTAKVDSILASEEFVAPPDHDAPWQFSSRHSVSIQEARSRLDRVHVLDWIMRLEQVKGERCHAEEDVTKRFRGLYTVAHRIPNLVEVLPISDASPLFCASLSNLCLSINKPSFSLDSLPDFLHQQGGLPKEMTYSLLVPLHINFTVSSLKVTLRDYPLALAHISSPSEAPVSALEFGTDLVIAEEMGLTSSVEWIDCSIANWDGADGGSSLQIMIPKTVMPVKSYANPEVRIVTPETSSFSWGISYAAATHDLMRVIESLTSAPRDPSPPVGFWDKMRLVFHWSLRASFRGDVRYHMKGLRDPYDIVDMGAGFVLSWRGNTKLLVGRKNEARELIQVISDSMFIAIPNLRQYPSPQSAPFKKICAKFLSGVRFGIGFVFERACGPSCTRCTGDAFHRTCRFFDFKPHYEVTLGKKSETPVMNGPNDSFAGFRSDFIHLSLSLTSSIRNLKPNKPLASSLHLTPKAFTYFYSWWSLFDSTMSLPIRLGSYYSSRTMSPKFGRHLATLKYHIFVPHLYVMHGYMDDSKETWVDGVTPWLGVKAMVDEFQVDMHQRDQETIVPGIAPSSVKVTRRKPFYAAELVMKGLDLRALLATFPEPEKQDIDVVTPPHKSNYRTLADIPTTDPESPWHDMDDFIETDWVPTSDANNASFHLLPIASCPRFAYFKKNSALLDDTMQSSKFGNEDTHQCSLGKEPSVPQVQTSLAKRRIEQLGRTPERNAGDTQSRQRKIGLLEQYIDVLQKAETRPSSMEAYDYQMPADSVSPDEWAEFDNVYQIHCPKLFLDSAVRDIMMQYYYCSRARRGFEYHMATRAIKFIRDQAKVTHSADSDHQPKDHHHHHHTAQAAASAIRKIFAGDSGKTQGKKSFDVKKSSESSALNPMGGWSEGVSLRKSHCCLLLKPQVVLRDRDAAEDTCVVTAVQVKLQSFVIMDDLNVEDPISGKVMTYAVLSGMQTFAPTSASSFEDSCVPLEVLIDLRCESEEFERLVPQTDATFHYDKFNRLRLRNNVTSVARKSTDSTGVVGPNHLQDQTDLIQVHIPNFTVTANDQHFQIISNIITKLLLFSDAAHKTRIDKLSTMMFTYDFTDLTSAAEVVSGVQRQIRNALDVEYNAHKSGRLDDEELAFELLKLRAHIVSLTEELNLLFEAIKFAQDRYDDQNDRKSALLLNASSSEISWRMLDDQRNMLAKLAVQNIDYYWLSRQDSSTVNNLSVGNLQAFDGSKDAKWAEIVSKYDDPPNHPLLKRGLFLTSTWIVLPPVGGITIYETFEMNLHPLRLQVDARVGKRIMEYLWPARKDRPEAIEEGSLEIIGDPQTTVQVSGRSSLDSPRSIMSRQASNSGTPSSGLAPPLRRLGASRSFTDLRMSASESSELSRPLLQRTRSSEALRLRGNVKTPESLDHTRTMKKPDANGGRNSSAGDAAEMRTRSSQKTFVLVRISSLHLLLSVMKEESFVCQDARIRTRDLEFRNQTWSFEELVNQFIPSDMSWKGWVKMALHQPLVPVLPVARELISKTKWIASKGGHSLAEHSTPKPSRLKPIAGPQQESARSSEEAMDEHLSHNTQDPPHSRTRWKKASRRVPEPVLFAEKLTAEPDLFHSSDHIETIQSSGRQRVLSLFSRSSSRSGHSNTPVPHFGRKSAEASRR